MIANLHPTPVAFGYARVSDSKQIDKGNSVPEQIERIKEYWGKELKDKGIPLASIEWDDRGVSATKRNFYQRAAGDRILGQIKEDDHFIVDKADRLWRNPKDFELLLDWFKRRRIKLHIINMNMVGGTLYGDMMLRLMVAWAAAEAGANSERHNRHNQIARKQGLAISNKPLTGTKHVKRYSRATGWKTYVEWDIPAREIMAEIVRLIESGIPCGKISLHLERSLAERNGRKFSESAFYKRYWTKQRVEHAYRVEKFLQDNDIKDVCDLPTNVTLAAHKHAQERGYLRSVVPYIPKKNYWES